MKFACVDGPEFDAHTVDFDELSDRLGTYKNQEKIAWEKLQQGHKCRLSEAASSSGSSK
jgi:hypothetical protein